MPPHVNAHLEVLLDDDTAISEQAPALLVKCLRKHPNTHLLTTNQELPPSTYMDNSHHLPIRSIKTQELCQSNNDQRVGVSLRNTHITLHFYSNVRPAQTPFNDATALPSELDAFVHVTDLPLESLDRQWESLYYDTNLNFKLLRRVTALVTNSPQNTPNLFLFHGPPGTGKTSLCHALAQKTAIRCTSYYKAFKFLEVQVAKLLDKFVGESQKHICHMFEDIQRLASDGSALVFVLFDEVESIASTRFAELDRGNSDIGRAVNAFLVSLDNLRSCHNVVVFCTTNIGRVLDKAFLDRVSNKELIDLPGLKARYLTMADEMTALMDDGKITTSEDPFLVAELCTNVSDDSKDLLGSWLSMCDWMGAVPEERPNPHWEIAMLYLSIGQASLTTAVLMLAMSSQGLSGRAIRWHMRVPFVGQCMDQGPALRAISEALQKEMAGLQSPSSGRGLNLGA